VTVETSPGQRTVIAMKDVLSMKHDETTSPIAPASTGPIVSDKAPVATSTTAHFQQRLTLGGGVGWLAVSTTLPGHLKWDGTGWNTSVWLGARLSPSVRLVTRWDHASLDGLAPLSVSSNAVGLDAQISSNPNGRVGVFCDLGAGYRWFTFSAGSKSVTANGIDLLRATLGLSIHASPRLDLQLYAGGSIGKLVEFDGSGYDDPEVQLYKTGGVAGTFDL
jgi:hypothetical protein